MRKFEKLKRIQLWIVFQETTSLQYESQSNYSTSSLSGQDRTYSSLMFSSRILSVSVLCYQIILGSVLFWLDIYCLSRSIFFRSTVIKLPIFSLSCFHTPFSTKLNFFVNFESLLMSCILFPRQWKKKCNTIKENTLQSWQWYWFNVQYRKDYHFITTLLSPTWNRDFFRKTSKSGPLKIIVLVKSTVFLFHPVCQTIGQWRYGRIERRGASRYQSYWKRLPGYSEQFW